MFISLHIPLADARRFNDQTPRLAKPSWPIPTSRDFVRSFGPVRHREGSAPFPSVWDDEEYYADASRAIRLFENQSDMTGPRAAVASAIRRRIKVAFRRLYSARGPIVRLELGLSLTLTPKLPQVGYDLLAALLELPLGVVPFRTAMVSTKLGQLGSRLADAYTLATTSVQPGTVDGKSLVRAGDPMLLVECLPHELGPGPPKGFAPFALAPATLKNMECTGMWSGSMIRYQQSTHVRIVSMLHPQNRQERFLRSGLARLHAERQVLGAMLRLIADKRLAVTPGSQGTADLREYLTKATTWLERKEVVKLPMDQLEPIIAAYEVGYTTSQRQTLSQELSRMTRHVAEKVEGYVKRQEEHQKQPTIAYYVAEKGATQVVNHVEGGIRVSMKSVNYGSNNTFHGPVVVADHIENSFNGAASLPEDDERRKHLESLVTQVTQLVEKQEQSKAQETARTLETFVNEARSENPRKDWLKLSADGLITAAKTVADMAGPITTTVMTIMKLFRLSMDKPG